MSNQKTTKARDQRAGKRVPAAPMTAKAGGTRVGTLEDWRGDGTSTRGKARRRNQLRDGS